MARRTVRIIHRPSGELIAEGPIGWGITPFAGSWYVRRKFLRTDGFQMNGVPGFCPYKFLYLWLDFERPGSPRSKNLAWRYVLPNPLLPFIAFRVGLSESHPELEVEITSLD